MSGRFSNTRYTDAVTSVISTMKNVIKNDFYKFSDLSPTPVEYYHINKNASTLDEGSRLAYDIVGADSPLRYNKINNMLIYGIDTPMSIDYANDEFGLESNPIEGDCVILPNTIEPYTDDRFMITYLNKKIIFRVIHVTPDTLEDGSNAYKIQYRSTVDKPEDLYTQVIKEYNFIIDNVGTEMNCLIESSTMDFINEIDIACLTLKRLYKGIFYNSRVQTFTYRYLHQIFYDPYMIEFMKNNKILDGDDQYICLQHQTRLSNMFPIHYMKTIMYCLEQKDYANVRKYNHRGRGFLIQDKFTIFANRMEPYWEIKFDFAQEYEPLQAIPCFRDEFILKIEDGETFEVGPTYYNIILKYLYDYDIDMDDIKELEKIDYKNNVDLFYAIPCIIYCLENIIKKMTIVNNKTSL